MSQELAGYSLKEWSLFILLGGLVFTFAFVGIGFGIAISNDPSKITISGDIDIGQFVGVIIGIAIVATTLVAQQLTKNQTIQAMKEAKA